VRAQVAKIAEDAGLEPARVADLRLAVTEIGTNAVTHAGVPTATLRLWSDGDRLVCEIRGRHWQRETLSNASAAPAAIQVPPSKV
jgi:anti-sigma regulatory factor (Ser/Thr protein kinase)